MSVVWGTRQQHYVENFNLSDRCLISKNLVEYLSDFQLNAIRFLWKHYKGGQGCILAGESGLGKISVLLAFISAIYSDIENCREKVLIVCKNPLGINHWMYQMKVLFPNTAFHENTTVIAPGVLNKELLSSNTYQYIVIDARHSMPLMHDEIKKLNTIACKRRVFITSENPRENIEDLRKILPCIDTKWLKLIMKSEDSQLIMTQTEKFLLVLQSADFQKELPLRKEKLYQQGYNEWSKIKMQQEMVCDILSQKNLNICQRTCVEDHLDVRFSASSLDSNSGTPDLIFSEEEVMKTSEKVLPNKVAVSQSTEEEDIIPASPLATQPPFRRRYTRRRIIKQDLLINSKETEKLTPNLFDSSEESETENEKFLGQKRILNTSPPLFNDSQKDFLCSQPPSQGNLSAPPPIASLNLEESEIFEITTNPTFSHKIRVSSKREISSFSASSQIPKTPECDSVASSETKWRKSLTKIEQDKCETPRSSTKSSGWLSKHSPKRYNNQRLTPRNLSITFEVRKKEEKTLKGAFGHPIPTQEPEDGFPKKRRRLRDFFGELSDDENS